MDRLWIDCRYLMDMDMDQLVVDNVDRLWIDCGYLMDNCGYGSAGGGG